MSATTITVQDLTKKGAKKITFEALNPDGMYFNNSGREIAVIKAAAASSVTVTVVSVPCSHQRTGDKVVAIAASEEHMIYALPAAEFNQTTAPNEGKVSLTFASIVGTVSIAVVRT